jgi:glycosyltransferase involved in cell wall biosynthesis
MKVCHIPPPHRWPPHGGVREHCRQLTKHLGLLGVEFVDNWRRADLIHTQSSYPPPVTRRPDVYTCHGGFWPDPIPQVLVNLKKARHIISVAEWIVEAFFPQYRHKTTVIPNGVDLSEWEDLGPSGIEPGFILWGKGFYRDDWHYFYGLAKAFPSLRFVSTLGAEDVEPLANLQIIGVQPQEQMRRLLHDAAVYVSTGSEVCPTMILEAWAAKTPVLAWDAHGNKELMEPTYYGKVESKGGLLYETLKEAVQLLPEVLSNSKQMGREGYRYVWNYYRWELLAQHTKEVYRGLL